MRLQHLALALLALFVIVGCDNTDSNTGPTFVGYVDNSTASAGQLVFDNVGAAADEVVTASIALVLDVYDDGQGVYNDNILSASPSVGYTIFVTDAAAGGNRFDTSEITVAIGEAESAGSDAGNPLQPDSVAPLRRTITIGGDVNAANRDVATGATINILLVASDGDETVTLTLAFAAVFADNT